MAGAYPFTAVWGARDSLELEIFLGVGGLADVDLLPELGQILVVIVRVGERSAGSRQLVLPGPLPLGGLGISLSLRSPQCLLHLRLLEGKREREKRQEGRGMKKEEKQLTQGQPADCSQRGPGGCR